MEKRKMYNANADLEGYNCLGCSPTNPYGLKCKFVDEGEYITCHWVPSENYQGFFHVLHGGIQATLIDEIASWAIFSHEKNSWCDNRNAGEIPTACPDRSGRNLVESQGDRSGKTVGDRSRGAFQ